MDPITITAILSIGGKLLDRLFPDPKSKAEAQMALLKMQQDGEFKEIEAELQRSKQQTDINLAEAQSSDPFRAGWRPFIGWVCGAAFLYDFVAGPLCAQFTSFAFHPLDMGEMMPVLLGMLGLGAYRTYEKTTQVKK